MNADNNTPESKIRQRYFLISKRWTAALLVLVLVIYGCAVLWSEFVFSVSWPNGGYKKFIEKLNCPAVISQDHLAFLDVGMGPPIKKRNVLLLDRQITYKNFTDQLSENPGCLAINSFFVADGGPDLAIVYHDRTSNKPVVKVTIESIEK